MTITLKRVEEIVQFIDYQLTTTYPDNTWQVHRIVGQITDLTDGIFIHCGVKDSMEEMGCRLNPEVYEGKTNAQLLGVIEFVSAELISQLMSDDYGQWIKDGLAAEDGS